VSLNSILSISLPLWIGQRKLIHFNEWIDGEMRLRGSVFKVYQLYLFLFSLFFLFSVFFLFKSFRGYLQTSNSTGTVGSFHIILSQFKRALGCVASRIAAETKLRRTFLIRPTKQGADIAARLAASNHYNRFSGHSPHWFHSSESEDAFNDLYTYKTHYKYQNFYDDSFDSESEREE